MAGDGVVATGRAGELVGGVAHHAAYDDLAGAVPGDVEAGGGEVAVDADRAGEDVVETGDAELVTAAQAG